MIKFLFSLCLVLTSAHSVFAASNDERIIEQFVSHAQKQVLSKNADEAEQHINHLHDLLKSFKQQANKQQLTAIQNEFKAFIQTWKATEAVYIAGALDEDYIDHPRYIDFFHQGKESTEDLVIRALNSDVKLNKALFKYSTKSINALEIILFPTSVEQLRSRHFRRIEAALIVTSNIQQWLEEINEFYQETPLIKSNPSYSLNLIVNALIESSYKLANWRVGAAGGLVKKYLGKPSTKHLEYTRSQSNKLAILSILKTHRYLLDNDANFDLVAVAESKNTAADILFVRQKVDDAIKQLTDIPEPLSEHIRSEQYKQLYKSLKQLYDAYYFLLADALELDPSIIDNDGD